MTRKAKTDDTPIRLVIPRWVPATLNKYVGRHWSRMARLKAMDRDMVSAYTRMARCAVAVKRRRYSVVITVATRRGRLPDPDGYLKSLLDALVNAGLLVDDSQDWCEHGGIEIRRGVEASTVIMLEDF